MILSPPHDATKSNYTNEIEDLFFSNHINVENAVVPVQWKYGMNTDSTASLLFVKSEAHRIL